MPAILFYNFNFFNIKISDLLFFYSCEAVVKWSEIIIILFPFLYIITVKSKLLNLGIKQEFSADLKREEKNRRTVYIFAPKNCQEKH